MSPTSAPTRTRREFGEHGVCYVRHGKAMKGSAPKRRSVLTVWPWVGEALAEWTSPDPAAARRQQQPGQHGVVALGAGAAGRAGPDRRPLRRPTATTLGLGPGLDFHSLRRSYVTHLIEAGWDPLFVQHQVGHEHASTTAIYTCVSSDFRTRTLRRALDATLAQATDPDGRPRPPRRSDRSQPGAADERARSATSGGCARSWPAAGCSPPPTSRRCWPNAASTLSASQVHRLVTGTPERLSLAVLAALCDILEVTPAELIVTTADNATVNMTPRAADGTTGSSAGDLANARTRPRDGAIRPTRARIRPEQPPR